MINVLVAPFTGAWIEIDKCLDIEVVRKVAPFTGAWIEINGGGVLYEWALNRRSLHGSVD